MAILPFGFASTASAQTIDLTTALPTINFPKEGAFTASEAEKKLPGASNEQVYRAAYPTAVRTGSKLFQFLRSADPARQDSQPR